MNDIVAKRAILSDLFASIDAMDTGQFLDKLAPTAEFRFGAAPAVRNKVSIGEAVDAFFTTIAGVRHDLTKIIEDGEAVACEGNVTYTRHDDTTVTLPFVNIFEFDGNLIEGYRIYIDITLLYSTAS